VTSEILENVENDSISQFKARFTSVAVPGFTTTPITCEL
jgi:hypothetical protein